MLLLPNRWIITVALGRAIKLLPSALRAQISSYEAEAEGCGGSTVEADNEVWANLRRNPKGRGRFSSPQPAKLTGDPDFPISSSLVVPVDQLQFSPHSSISEKSAPGADGRSLMTHPSPLLPGCTTAAAAWWPCPID
jgi:hypothetical protein